MHAKYKWLLVPPALALLLFLGPLRDSRPNVVSESPAAAPGPRTSLAASAMPSAWQIGSTLLGVLLLGGVVVTLLARARRSRPHQNGDRLLAVRETLRLGPKHTLHLVQVDDRLLLVGAADGAITCLAGNDPGAPALAAARSDDASPAHRAGAAARAMADDDDTDTEGGAVPRDMVIPRPPARTAALADFRTLLRRARVAHEQTHAAER